MSYPNKQTNPAAAIPVYFAAGPVAVVVPTTPFPATIAANTTYASGALAAGGYRNLAATAQLSAAGTLAIQRYADAEKAVSIGAPVSVVLSAGVANSVTISDGVPYLYYEVSIANTTGGPGTLTGANILQGA
jgi:hypothetical protein